MHARGVLDSSHRTSLHRASTQNLEREESALRTDTQFNECTAEERKAVSPLFPSHHSSSVSTEQAYGIVLSHTHSCPASQLTCHAVTLGPCVRVTMSHESWY